MEALSSRTAAELALGHLMNNMVSRFTLWLNGARILFYRFPPSLQKIDNDRTKHCSAHR